MQINRLSARPNLFITQPRHSICPKKTYVPQDQSESSTPVQEWKIIITGRSTTPVEVLPKIDKK